MKMRELRALGVPLEGRPNEKAPARPRTPARIGVPITPEPPRDPHVPARAARPAWAA